MDHTKITQLLLIEAVKSISRILSEILENEYKFFTEAVETHESNGGITVIYRGAGRVVK
jgi:hypothetical protein